MKPSRAAAFLLAACFVLGLLAGCTSNASFTVLAESIPENLDPQLAQTAAEKTAVINLFEGLYRLNEAGQPVPAAAEGIAVSGDGRTYTFTLREGMYWASYRRDGESVTPAVTADDFLFAFQRIFTRQTASPWAATFANIENAAGVLAGTLSMERLGVEATGTRTLVIRLERADPAFPEKLAAAGAMPCNRDFFDYTAGAYGLTYANLLTNGPFSIYAWAPGERLSLARNEDVGGWVNSVTFQPPGEESAGGFAGRYAAGEGSGAMTAAAADGTTRTWSLTTWAFLFNCENEFLALADARAALATVALQAELPLAAGSREKAEGLVPPGVTAGSGRYRDVAGPAYTLSEDPAALMRRAVATQAGESEDFPAPPTLTVLVPEGKDYAELFDEIHERWQRGLSCFFAVEALPGEELDARVRAGAYDIALLPLYAQSDDPAEMLATFAGDANPTGWRDEDYAALVAAAQGSSDEGQRTALCAKAERVLLAGWPLVPLFYETNHFATRADYAGLAVNPFGPVLEFSAPAAEESP